MGTTLSLALRYLTARREGRGLSIVPLLSGLGIMVGVATLVVVMAVFEGYRGEILDRLLSRTGHLVVTKPGFRTFDADEAMGALGTLDAQTGSGIASVQPVQILQGLLLNGNQGRRGGLAGDDRGCHGTGRDPGRTQLRVLIEPPPFRTTPLRRNRALGATMSTWG